MSDRLIGEMDSLKVLLLLTLGINKTGDVDRWLSAYGPYPESRSGKDDSK